VNKYHFVQQECQECKHIWWLISDQPIDYYLYITWIVAISAEHLVLRQERENNENNSM